MHWQFLPAWSPRHSAYGDEEGIITGFIGSIATSEACITSAYRFA